MFSNPTPKQKMKRSNILHKVIFTAMAALLAVGCTNIFSDGDLPSDGEASLTLTIATKAPTTRQIGAANSAVAGEKMNNLTMLMVENNTICHRVDISMGDAEFNAENTEAVIHLDGLVIGPHTFYLIANTGSLSLNLNTYSQGLVMSAAQLNALQNAVAGAALTGTATPTYNETNGMPMTAVVDYTLRHGSNTLDVEVERVVARFGVVVNNHVVDDNYKVVVTHFHLSAFNAPNTYLFNHNNAVPGGTTYREFLTDESSHYVDNGGTHTLFDNYIYETGSATYTLAFDVAVFESSKVGATPPSIEAATAGPDLTTPLNSVADTGGIYFLCNRNNGRYLGISGGNLVMTNVTNWESVTNENYLWKFTDATSSTMQNVGTGQYIYRTDGSNLGLTSNAASAEKFAIGTNESLAYFRSSYTNNNYYYFLAGTSLTRQNNKNRDYPSGNQQRWTLYYQNIAHQWSQDPQAEVHYEAPLMVISNVDGRVLPLTKIRRNENLQVGVNIFFNPQDGYFNFEVLPWVEDKGGDVTFD